MTYEQAMRLEDDGFDYERAMHDDYIASIDALPVDYEAEYADWLEYNDCIKSGFYNRQHALAVKGNAENGIVYYQTDDVRVLALGYIEE